MDKTVSVFCPEEQQNGGLFIQVGSCCTDAEEEAIREKFEDNPWLSDECAALHKQVYYLH